MDGLTLHIWGIHQLDGLWIIDVDSVVDAS